MNGVTMDELYEFITHSREIEFEYKDTTYVLEPNFNDGIKYLAIWDCTPDKPNCIVKEKVGEGVDIPKQVIDKVLLDKCFNGKSFLDIEKDVTVTYIY